MQTRAIVDFGELALNKAIRVYGPIGDLSIVNGRYYPSKAPLMSFAAVPVYAVLRRLSGGAPRSVPEIPLVYWSRLLLTVAPTLVMLFLLRRFLVAFVEPVVADALTMAYALGTLAFSYSLLFMSHQTTAALLFFAFYSVWRCSGEPEPNPVSLALGGFFGSLAVAAEYTSALCAALLGIYVILTWARYGWRKVLMAICSFCVGALPILSLLLLYHSTVFGGPFETGYKHLADSAYQPWHQGGFLGIKTPDARALALSLFSPLRGLFALSPMLLVGIAGLGLLWKRGTHDAAMRVLAIFSLLLLASYLYFTASFSYESWGWTTGPRHLTGLVPFLLLPIALVFDRPTSSIERGLLSGLVLGSILVTAALTSINYIPDDVSEGVFGLFVPLATHGFIMPSLLDVLGLVPPWGGLFCLALVFTLLTGVTHSLLRRRGLAPWFAAISVVFAVLLCHRIAFYDTPADRAARALLARDWLAAPGEGWQFWSDSGR
jgi:hypothetical protein